MSFARTVAERTCRAKRRSFRNRRLFYRFRKRKSHSIVEHEQDRASQPVYLSVTVLTRQSVHEKQSKRQDFPLKI